MNVQITVTAEDWARAKQLAEADWAAPQTERSGYPSKAAYVAIRATDHLKDIINARHGRDGERNK